MDGEGRTLPAQSEVHGSLGPGGSVRGCADALVRPNVGLLLPWINLAVRSLFSLTVK